MKLCIQIPCLNEAATLPATLAGIPKSIQGVDEIEVIVIDDGSSDGTSEVARAHGVSAVIRHKRNLGLAFSFRAGIDECLRRGADVIVNLDGDNQYLGADIPKLIVPIMSGAADVVVGSRDTDRIPHFSSGKKFLQRFGSSVMRKLSHMKVRDAVSGFRAFSREAALRLTILSNYTYTLESILQARTKGITVIDVEIGTNPKTRESRLIANLRTYLTFSIATILRVFTMYNPLRVFVTMGTLFLLLGAALSVRFLYFYLFFGDSGKVQSLILAAITVIIGAMCYLIGVLADLIQFNRRLLEDILERVKRLEME